MVSVAVKCRSATTHPRPARAVTSVVLVELVTLLPVFKLSILSVSVIFLVPESIDNSPSAGRHPPPAGRWGVNSAFDSANVAVGRSGLTWS